MSSGTLLESWELALSVAERPCYRAWMMQSRCQSCCTRTPEGCVWQGGLAQQSCCAAAVGGVGAQAGFLTGLWAWIGFGLPMPALVQRWELALSLAEQPC